MILKPFLVCLMSIFFVCFRIAWLKYCIACVRGEQLTNAKAFLTYLENLKTIDAEDELQNDQESGASEQSHGSSDANSNDAASSHAWERSRRSSRASRTNRTARSRSRSLISVNQSMVE